MPICCLCECPCNHMDNYYICGSCHKPESKCGQQCNEIRKENSILKKELAQCKKELKKILENTKACIEDSSTEKLCK